MTFGELKKMLQKAEEGGVQDHAEVYVDVFECLAFRMGERVLVIDVNDGELFMRDSLNSNPNYVRKIPRRS